MSRTIAAQSAIRIPLTSARIFGVLTAISIALTSVVVGAAAPRNVFLAGDRTEPILAVDPVDPSTIVVGSNTNYDAPVGGTEPTAVFVSHDGGRTFRFANVPMTYPYTTGADPGVAIAGSGTIFYSYLGETAAYCSGGRSAVLLTTSTDHGAGFRTPTVVHSSPSDDRPSLAVRSVPGGKAHVYLVWTEWHLPHGSRILFSRSVDGGAHFGPAIQLYNSAIDNMGATVAVGTRGRLFVFWANFPDTGETAITTAHMLVRASSDDGAHFGPVKDAVGAVSTMPWMENPGALRNLTAPSVAVGPEGWLYLAWAQVSRRLGATSAYADIMISRSTDGAKHWSRPRRLNDVPQGDRFMPTISAFPDGSIGAVFYDRRSGPAALQVYAVHATFRGGFRSTRNVKVNGGSPQVSDIYYLAPGSTCFAPGRFFGDYIGGQPCGSAELCSVWADTQRRIHNQTDVWFARVPLPALTSARRTQ